MHRSPFSSRAGSSLAATLAGLAVAAGIVAVGAPFGARLLRRAGELPERIEARLEQGLAGLTQAGKALAEDESRFSFAAPPAIGWPSGVPSAEPWPVRLRYARPWFFLEPRPRWGWPRIHRR